MKTLDLIMQNRERIKDIIERCKCSDPKLLIPIDKKGVNEIFDVDIIITISERASGWKIAGAELKLEKLLGTKVDLICHDASDRDYEISIKNNLINI